MDCDKELALNDLPKLASRIDFSISECELVLIKPNVCGFYHPSLELLSTILSYFQEYTKRIVVGETSSMMHEPKFQFKKLGYDRLTQKFGDKVKVADLSEEDSFRVEVPEPHVLNEINLPETVMKSDIIVNVPKLGTHSTTKITNALKNIFGLLPEKRKQAKYHPLGMHKVIADIDQIIKTDLTITDAEKNVIMGTDPLLVDIQACKYINADPQDIEHLKLVSKNRSEDLSEMKKKLKII